MTLQPPVLDASNLDFQRDEAAERQSFLTTTENFACPPCNGLAMFRGQGPQAPVYVLVVSKPSVPAVDIYYWCEALPQPGTLNPK